MEIAGVIISWIDEHEEGLECDISIQNLDESNLSISIDSQILSTSLKTGNLRIVGESSDILSEAISTAKQKKPAGLDEFLIQVIISYNEAKQNELGRKVHVFFREAQRAAKIIEENIEMQKICKLEIAIDSDQVVCCMNLRRLEIPEKNYNTIGLNYDNLNISLTIERNILDFTVDYAELHAYLIDRIAITVTQRHLLFNTNHVIENILYSIIKKRYTNSEFGNFFCDMMAYFKRVIENPSKYCISCLDELPFDNLQIRSCLSPNCEHYFNEYYPLDIFNELKNNLAKVEIDFLFLSETFRLNCNHETISEFSSFLGYNHNAAMVGKIFSKIPLPRKLIQNSSDKKELLNYMQNECGEHYEQCYKLLYHIIATNRLIIRKARTDQELYCVFNHEPSHMRLFTSLKRDYGSIYGYYTTDIDSWYTIMRKGFQEFIQVNRNLKTVKHYQKCYTNSKQLLYKITALLEIIDLEGKDYSSDILVVPGQYTVIRFLIIQKYPE